MTKFHRELLECNYCLNEEETVVWDVIDADSDPDLIEKILLKELQIFYCQNCQRSYLLPRPFLVIDRARKYLIYFAADFSAAEKKELPRAEDGRLLPDLEKHLPHDFGFSTEGFALRLVADYNELIEKIHVARSGLSDRLLELLKAAMRLRLFEDDRKERERAEAAYAEDPKDKEPLPPYDPEEERRQEQLLFLGREDKKLLFQRFTPSTGWRQLELDEAAYDGAEMRLGDKLPPEGQWEKIDESWALVFSKSLM